MLLLLIVEFLFSRLLLLLLFDFRKFRFLLMERFLLLDFIEFFIPLSFLSGEDSSNSYF